MKRSEALRDEARGEAKERLVRSVEDSRRRRRLSHTIVV
jgi:hypothetical protein